MVVPPVDLPTRRGSGEADLNTDAFESPREPGDDELFEDALVYRFHFRCGEMATTGKCTGYANAYYILDPHENPPLPLGLVFDGTTGEISGMLPNEQPAPISTTGRRTADNCDEVFYWGVGEEREDSDIVSERVGCRVRVIGGLCP